MRFCGRCPGAVQYQRLVERSMVRGLLRDLGGRPKCSTASCRRGVAAIDKGLPPGLHSGAAPDRVRHFRALISLPVNDRRR